MRISIVTPTLNASRFLDACARSVRREILPDVEFEHIVVDGGSTDETIAIAVAHRCRVVQEPDDGIFEAANRGYELATGDLVGFLGADDELMPGASIRLRDWHVRRRASWVVGSLRWVDRAGNWLGDIGPPPSWMTAGMYASLGWNCIHHLSTYMVPDFFERLGGFDRRFRYSGDYDFFARALAAAPFERIRGPIASHRRHGANASMSLDPRVAAENEWVAERYGPASAALRDWNRLALRVWVNGTNPRWALRKLLMKPVDRRPTGPGPDGE